MLTEPAQSWLHLVKKLVAQLADDNMITMQSSDVTVRSGWLQSPSLCSLNTGLSRCILCASFVLKCLPSCRCWRVVSTFRYSQQELRSQPTSSHLTPMHAKQLYRSLMVSCFQLQPQPLLQQVLEQQQALPAGRLSLLCQIGAIICQNWPAGRVQSRDSCLRNFCTAPLSFACDNWDS